MSSNKIETADFEFEVSDEIYDAIQNILKPYAVAQSKTYIPGKVREYVEKRTKEYFGEEPTSPTVEISLEDAKLMLNNLYGWQSVLNEKGWHSNNPTHIKIMEQAISKAESKEPINTPALPIQDQVNELRKDVECLKHSMEIVIKTQNNGVVQKINQHTDEIHVLQSKMEEIFPTLS